MNLTSNLSGEYAPEPQTAQNTVMPHEALPTTEIAPQPVIESKAAPVEAGDRPEYSPDGHKIYYFKNRSAGVIRVDGKFKSLDPNHIPKKKKKKIQMPEIEQVAAPIVSPKKGEADALLKTLVQKLVAMENDSQYRSVWSHFFTFGGVYNGPRYLDELQAAINYLIKTGQ